MGSNSQSTVNIVRRYQTIDPIDKGQQPLAAEDIAYLVGLYFTNVRGGSVADPTRLERPTGSAPRTKPAISLDYSLQLEAGLARMCRACDEGKLLGEVPAMCKPEMGGRVNKTSCSMSVADKVLQFFGATVGTPLSTEPRQ